VALLAVLCGLIGLGFKTVLYQIEDLCDRVRGHRSEWARPAVGGVVLGLLRLALPQLYGVGYPVMYSASAGDYAIWFLLVLAAAKMVAGGSGVGRHPAARGGPAGDSGRSRLSFWSSTTQSCRRFLGVPVMAGGVDAVRPGRQDGDMEDPTAARVLLVEDDPQLVRLLVQLLTEEGYAVESALDGHRGLHLGLTKDYDVLVLDRGLPAVDGLDLLTRLRQRGIGTPVLVLSALGNPADRVEGLDAGAEDYLAKPFDIDELLARLRALRRRNLDSARSLRLGTRRLDLDSRLVDGDPPVRLSERECAVLAALAGRPGKVFTRRELLAIAFGTAESDAVVDTYVHYLRRKLGREVVVTVHGRGYQLGRA
jgi:two-component system response regulator QseB